MEDRERLKQTILDQTKHRIKFVLGPDATEEDIAYCAEPYIGIVERYSKLVDDSRVEINQLNGVLEE